MAKEIVEVKLVQEAKGGYLDSKKMFVKCIKKEIFEMQSSGLAVEVQYAETSGTHSALILGRKPE